MMRLTVSEMRQLGEPVTATGADALDAETLAGGLLAMMEAGDLARKEGWRKRGQAFFQRRSRGAGRKADDGEPGAKADNGGAASA